MRAFKIFGLFFLSSVPVVSFSQSLRNLISPDSFRTNLRNEAETKFMTVKRNDHYYLKIISASTPRTPATYLVKCPVNPGEVYTYMFSGSACAKNRVALYITSSGGNIGWPGTMIEENGIVKQTFTTPENVHDVTLAVSFLYPKENECVYINDIGLFSGSPETSAWKTSDGEGLRPYIIREKNNAIDESKENLPVENRRKKTLPPNLFNIGDLSIITMEDPVEMSLIKKNGEGFLKITCSPTAKTPSIYFATIRLQPNKTYSYFVQASPSPDAKVFFYVKSPIGNIVWPGLKLIEGVNKQSFTLPANTNEITIGMSFAAPSSDDYVLIKDVALYEGEVDPRDWSSNENEGLRQYLTLSNKHWLWLIFPFSISILIALYFRRKNPSDH